MSEGVPRCASFTLADPRSHINAWDHICMVFFYIRPSSVRPHQGSGIMATPRSITVVHAGLSGAFNKTIPHISSSGTYNHQGMPTRPRISLRDARTISVPLTLNKQYLSHPRSLISHTSPHII